MIKEATNKMYSKFSWYFCLNNKYITFDLLLLAETRRSYSVAWFATFGPKRKDEPLNYCVYCTSSSAYPNYSQGYGGRCFLFHEVMQNKTI
jgi:hypothetical protein